jgi:hypothetical protein
LRFPGINDIYISRSRLPTQRDLNSGDISYEASLRNPLNKMFKSDVRHNADFFRTTSTCSFTWESACKSNKGRMILTEEGNP